MKKSRNVITLFLAICALFLTQAFAAEVGKAPSVPAQADEKAATTTGQGQTREKPPWSRLTGSVRY
jgi:hypothetical protein